MHDLVAIEEVAGHVDRRQTTTEIRYGKAIVHIPIE